MSLFRDETFPCPDCLTPVTFQVAESLNADRRPDLRAAILDATYQRGTCPACGRSFRIEPHLTYLDVGRGQWILTLPAEALPRWADLERGARDMFADSFGPAAPLAARQIGERMATRVVFGWSGLREKLLCGEHGVDDAALEALKAELLRAGDAATAGDARELRLIGVEGDTLLLAWLFDDGDTPMQTLRVPRDLLAEIAAGPAWQGLRERLTAGPFTDLNRLLVPVAPEK